MLLLAALSCCLIATNAALADPPSGKSRTMIVNCNQGGASVQSAIDAATTHNHSKRGSQHRAMRMPTSGSPGATNNTALTATDRIKGTSVHVQSGKQTKNGRFSTTAADP